MTLSSQASPDAGLAGEVAAAPAARTAPFAWSVRRELWENRAIWIAPLAAAGVVLFGFVIGLAHLPNHQIMIDMGKHVHRPLPVEAPYAFGAYVIVLTGIVTAFFYCLGALGGERRDRSILFWKSLPVSDLTTVASKAFMPFVVMPLATFVVVLGAILVMLGLSAAAAAIGGSAVAASWTHASIGDVAGMLAYTLVVMALWYAPIWGWTMLVGGWARRVGFLWVVGPPLALGVIERIAFGTHYVFQIVGSRIDPPAAAFHAPQGKFDIDVGLLDPVGFVTSPGLWIGLAFGLAFFAAAVRLRRYRDPI